MSKGNGAEWEKWSQHVLITLEQLHEECDKLNGKVHTIDKKVVAIKTTAVVLATGASLVIAVISLVLRYAT